MRATANRMSWQSMVGLGGAAMASVVLGAVAASGAIVTTGVLVALLLAGMAVLLYGRMMFPVALIVVIPLIPVVGNPPPSGASTLRLGVMALLLSGGFLIHIQSGERLHAVQIRALITALMILAATGILIAVADGSSTQDTLKTLSLAAGQPIAYAGFLGLFSLAIQDDEGNRKRLLIAWAVVMIAEGLYVTREFATGGSFDVLRGYSRGQGTTGADFLGAFSAISFFGAMALRAAATSRRTRLLAWAAMFAAAGSLLASISRGSLIGLGVGLIYVLLRRRSSSPVASRRPIALVLILTVILGGGLYATRGLWLSRLASHSTGTASGRSATWASGLLIARDHPLTGVGPDNLITVIQNDPRYNSTEYGKTTSTPSDMWIFALAAGGLLYGLAVIWVTFRFFTIVRHASSGQSSRESLYLETALVVTLPIFTINNIFTHPEDMVLVMLAIALLVVPRKLDVLDDGTHTRQRNVAPSRSEPC